jgi:hypothetical protein
MILLNRKVSHNFVNTEEFQNIEAVWEFHMEESDIPDPDMRYRFNSVQVTQRKNLCVGNNRPWKLLTWFKGSNTQTFGKETKDKQKQEIIKIVEKYLLDNNVPIIHHYESAEPNN